MTYSKSLELDNENKLQLRSFCILSEFVSDVCLKKFKIGTGFETWVQIDISDIYYLEKFEIIWYLIWDVSLTVAFCRLWDYYIIEVRESDL